MITVNGQKIHIDSFPDGTILMKQHNTFGPRADIGWTFENDREFLALIYTVKHLRRNGFSPINLYMPYIPNARMDRVKSDEEVFTLKYFVEVLNDLKLDSVTVLDPHSSVSEALIDNLTVVTPKNYISEVLHKIAPFKSKDGLLMFYPDEGAMKRYAAMVNRPYVFGIKDRDWKTGVIKNLTVMGAVNEITGKDVLIIDDICSRGGTFLHSAKKLKELGANDIYLYITHCENTILEGELLEGDLIKRVYTTNSIFTKEHEKIEVL